MTTGKALLGVLAGLAAGVTIGVIFGPDKGSGARKNVTKKGEDLANALNETIDEKFEQLMNSINGKVKATRPHNGEPSSAKSELVK